MKVKLITNPFFSWLFYKTGFKGWTSLWGVVYIRGGEQDFAAP